MKLIPNSTARRRTRTASDRSTGPPQTPLPVIRIAPNPNWVTRRSFPIRNSPAFAARPSPCCMAGLLVCISFLPFNPNAESRRPELPFHSVMTPSQVLEAAGAAGQSSYRQIMIALLGVLSPPRHVDASAGQMDRNYPRLTARLGGPSKHSPFGTSAALLGIRLGGLKQERREVT